MQGETKKRNRHTNICELWIRYEQSHPQGFMRSFLFLFLIAPIFFNLKFYMHIDDSFIFLFIFFLIGLHVPIQMLPCLLGNTVLRQVNKRRSQFGEVASGTIQPSASLTAFDSNITGVCILADWRLTQLHCTPKSTKDPKLQDV